MHLQDYLPILISIAALIVSITSYLVTKSQLKLSKNVFNAEHEHNRRQIALDLLCKWDSDTLESRKYVMAKWSDNFYNSNVISWDEIERFRIQQIEEFRTSGNVTSKHLITDHMTTILNYFDLIGVSVVNNIADKTILEHSIKKTFQRWYLILTDFRRHVNQKRGYRPWFMAEKLYKGNWFPDNPPEPLGPVDDN